MTIPSLGGASRFSSIDSYREHLKEKLALDNGADLVRHAIQSMRSEAAR